MIYQDLDEAGDRPAVRKVQECDAQVVWRLLPHADHGQAHAHAHADHGQALLPIMLVEVPTILPSLVSPPTLE